MYLYLYLHTIPLISSNYFVLGIVVIALLEIATCFNIQYGFQLSTINKHAYH